MFWDWKLTADIWPLLLQASVVTVQATILGFAIAAVLGLLLAIGRMYGRPWLRVPLGGIVEFIRSTPLLIQIRSEEHTSELQSLMRISYAVFCLKKKHKHRYTNAQQSTNQR